MRTSATVLTAAILAMSSIPAVLADVITVDGMMYTDDATQVFVDSPYAVPVNDTYVEVLYVPDADPYQEMPVTIDYTQEATFGTDSYETSGEAPVFVEYVQDAMPEAMMTDQTVMSETIDGIVYETMIEDGTMPVVQTY